VKRWRRKKMKILLEDGIKYLLYQYKDEDELEQMVVEHSEIIFGKDSVLFPGQKIKARSRIATIPDGFVLLIDDKEWYILEVELASHPLHEHIVVQMSKFNSAIRNPRERNKLIDAFFDEIEYDAQLKYKFDSKGITTELHKFISDVIVKDPKLIIVIDKEGEELKEVCESLPFRPIVLNFQTYYREGIDIRVHIHHLDTLKVIKGRIPPEKAPSETKEAVPATLEEILEVYSFMKNGKTYTEACKEVAKKRSISEGTVRDKCTRQLGLNTEEFNRIIKNKDEFATLLSQKFPKHKEYIEQKVP
jgi:hypothetical protein